MDLGLTNRVALVIAASKGIGFAVADGLAKEGCNLIITSSNPSNLDAAKQKLEKRHKGINISAYQMDLRDRESVVSTINSIIDSASSVDILVLNGPGPKPMEAKDLDAEVLLRSMSTTVSNFVEACYRIMPTMIASGFGRILFLASSTAKEPDAGMVLSNVGRAAVIAYAKSLSREVASHGITVNSILTGSVLTDRSSELLKFEAVQLGVPMERFLKEAAASIPAGYICSPAEFVNAVVFLCSTHASYINGVSLPIDGGYMRGL